MSRKKYPRAKSQYLTRDRRQPFSNICSKLPQPTKITLCNHLNSKIMSTKKIIQKLISVSKEKGLWKNSLAFRKLSKKLKIRLTHSCYESINANRKKERRKNDRSKKSKGCWNLNRLTHFQRRNQFQFQYFTMMKCLGVRITAWDSERQISIKESSGFIFHLGTNQLQGLPSSFLTSTIWKRMITSNQTRY